MARTKQSVIDANKARAAMGGAVNKQPAMGGVKKRTTRLTKMEQKVLQLKEKLEAKQVQLATTKKRVHQKEERKALLKKVRAQLDAVTMSEDFVKLSEFYSDGLIVDLKADHTTHQDILSSHYEYGSNGKWWDHDHYFGSEDYTDSECETLEDWETDVTNSSSSSSSSDDSDEDTD